MARPPGPTGNPNCEYCFYLEKEALFPENEQYRMSDQVLEAYIRKTAEYQTVRMGYPAEKVMELVRNGKIGGSTPTA